MFRLCHLNYPLIFSFFFIPLCALSPSREMKAQISSERFFSEASNALSLFDAFSVRIHPSPKNLHNLQEPNLIINNINSFNILFIFGNCKKIWISKFFYSFTILNFKIYYRISKFTFTIFEFQKFSQFFFFYTISIFFTFYKITLEVFASSILDCMRCWRVRVSHTL